MWLMCFIYLTRTDSKFQIFPNSNIYNTKNFAYTIKSELILNFYSKILERF